MPVIWLPTQPSVSRLAKICVSASAQEMHASSETRAIDPDSGRRPVRRAQRAVLIRKRQRPAEDRHAQQRLLHAQRIDAVGLPDGGCVCQTV